jgi:hypothetical protein
MFTVTEPTLVHDSGETSTVRTIEVLSKRTLRRERRRRLKWLGVALVVLGIGGAITGPATSAFGSSPSHSASADISAAASTKTSVLTCRDTLVVKPASFIITCADANTQLTQTRWSSWTSVSALGTTRFAMNLCKPNCAASPMSYFPKSHVTLSAPVTTKKGKLFSLMVVRYTMNGMSMTYRFSWKGDPSF